MRLLLTFLIMYLSLFSNTTIAKNETHWLSPTVKKYLINYPKLKNDYINGKKIIDNYRGDRKRLENAYSIFNKMVKDNPNFVPAYLQLSRIIKASGYIKYQKYDQHSLATSLSILNKAIELDSNFVYAYVNSADLYVLMKKPIKAKQFIDKAKSFNVDIPHLKEVEGSYYESIDKSDKALELYKQVFNNTKDQITKISAASSMTRIYTIRKQYDKAKELYLYQIKIQPNNHYAYGNYASFLLFNLVDINKAIEYAEKAKTISSYRSLRTTLITAYYLKWAQIIQDNKIKNGGNIAAAMQTHNAGQAMKEATSKGNSLIAMGEAIKKEATRPLALVLLQAIIESDKFNKKRKI